MKRLNEAVDKLRTCNARLRARQTLWGEVRSAVCQDTVRKALDRNAIRALSGGDAAAGTTWASLARDLLESDMDPPCTDLGEALKTLVLEASRDDDSSGSGAFGRIALAAPLLFEKAQVVLAATPPAMGLFAPYCDVVRMLCACHECAQALVPALFSGVACALLTALLLAKERESVASETLAALCAAFPFGAARLPSELFELFTRFFSEGDATRRRPAVSASVLAALTSIVLSAGVNVVDSPAAQECSVAALGFSAKLFDATDAKLRLRIITFCRAQLRLHRKLSGALLPLPFTADFVDAMRSELEKIRPVALPVSPSKLLPITDDHADDGLAEFLDCAADMFLRAYMRLNGVDGAQPEAAPPKRRRSQLSGADVLEEVLRLVSCDGRKKHRLSLPWLRLCTALLAKHGESLDPGFSKNLLSFIEQYLSDASQDFHDHEAVLTSLWAFKAISAVCEIPHLAASAGSRSDWEDCWRAVVRAANLLGHASEPLSCAFAALNDIFCARLVSLDFALVSQADIWKLPVFAEAPSSPLVALDLHFISAFLPDCCRRDAGSLAFVSHILKWSLSALFTLRPGAQRSANELVAMANSLALTVHRLSAEWCEQSHSFSSKVAPILPLRKNSTEDALHGIEESFEVFAEARPQRQVPQISDRWRPTFLEETAKWCSDTCNRLLMDAACCKGSELENLYLRVSHFVCLLAALYARAMSSEAEPAESEASSSTILAVGMFRLLAKLGEIGLGLGRGGRPSADYARCVHAVASCVAASVPHFVPNVHKSVVALVEQLADRIGKTFLRDFEDGRSHALEEDDPEFGAVITAKTPTSHASGTSDCFCSLFQAIACVAKCRDCKHDRFDGILKDAIPKLWYAHFPEAALTGLRVLVRNFPQEDGVLLGNTGIYSASKLALMSSQYRAKFARVFSGILQLPQTASEMPKAVADVSEQISNFRKQPASWKDLFAFIECTQAIFRASKNFDLFLPFLKDPDFRVATRAATAIEKLFQEESTTEMHSKLFQFVMGNFSNPETLAEKAAAMLLLRVLSCSRIPDLEVRAMSLFCRLAPRHEVLSLVVGKSIAERLGFSSTSELFEEALPILMMLWLQDINDFPIWLVGANSVSEFANKFTALSVAHAVLRTDEPELRRVSSTTRKTIPELLTLHFPLIFSWAAPLVYEKSSTPRGKEIWDVFISKFSSKNELMGKMGLRGNEVFSRLFLASTPFSVLCSRNGPPFMATTVKAVLENTTNEPLADFLHSRTRVHDLLFELNVCIEKAKLASTQATVAHSLAFFADCLDSHIVDPSNMRELLNSTLRVIRATGENRELPSLTIETLKTLCAKILREAPVRRDSLFHRLRPVVSELQRREKSSKAASEFLQWLFSLEEARQATDTASAMLLESGDVNDAMRMFWLDVFSEQLRQDRVVAPQRFLRSLVRDCRNAVLGNAAVADKAAACLGEIGVLDSASLSSFDYAPEPVEALAKRALEFLSKCVVDEDLGVAKAATFALRKIFATPQIEEVIKELDSSVKEELRPFLLPSRSLSPTSTQEASIPTDAATWSTEGKTYNKWICSLVHSLSLAVQEPQHRHRNSEKPWVVPFFRAAGKVAAVKPELAELIFGPLFAAVVESAEENEAHDLARLCNSELLSPSNRTVEALRATLVALNHILWSSTSLLVVHQKLAPSKRSADRVWSSGFWAGINLLLAASASLRCRAYVTALRFAELWSETKLDVHQALCIPADGVSENESREIRRVLLEVYRNIGEPDCIFALGASPELQLPLCEHSGEWGRAVSLNEVAALQDTAARTESHHAGLISALRSQGHVAIASQVIRGLAAQQHGQQLSDLRLEMAWRMAHWSESTPEEPKTLHESVYSSLQALQLGALDSASKALHHARLEIARRISQESSECASNMQPKLASLQMLSDISRIAELAPSREHIEACMRELSRSKWVGDSKVWPLELYDLVEPTLALRAVLLETFSSKQDVAENVLPHLLSQARYARIAGRFPAALVLLGRASSMARSEEAQIETCKLLWAEGDRPGAILHLKSLVKERFAKEELRASALCRLGTWMSETRAAPRDAIELLFREALECLPLSDKVASRTHFRFAQFSDALFQLQRGRDSDISLVVEHINEKQRELEDCNAALAEVKPKERLSAPSKVAKQPLSKKIIELKTHKERLERQIALMEREHQRQQEDRKSCFVSSVEHYAEALRLSGKFDTEAMFRLCSLWFSEMDSEVAPKEAQKVDARKFVPLLYQIASRIGVGGAFGTSIASLVERVAREHPHQALWVLSALRNGNKVPQSDEDQVKQTKSEESKQRIEAAERIFALLRGNPHLCEHVEQLERFSGALLALAFTDTTGSKPSSVSSRSYRTPDACYSIKNLERVQVPTVEPDFGAGKPSVFVGALSKQFFLVGGVNKPKRIDCEGSDGRTYTMLVKSRDDMRQDAVMQQAFRVVNMLLEECNSMRAPHRRELSVRTYRVVPLSPTSGIVEWVRGTVPMGEYLVGVADGRNGEDQGAHARYYPSDLTSHTCRTEFSKTADRRTSFDRICGSFHPVFHNFFLEQFSTPVEWFARRLAFTRSTATNSITGYILGLGDRHTQNILLDKRTAEVVHIDLGVAFEQGKALRTPEIVPFRLTRDIIDGMGVTGCDGVFRRCCEETLRVLRARSQTLVTIIEVFLFDPLYNWTLSPAAASRKQVEIEDSSVSESRRRRFSVTATEACTLRDSEADFSPPQQPPLLLQQQHQQQRQNKDAGRTLQRLKDKLQGVEYGVSLSVEGQVSQLILEATDPGRLCQLFPGWAPWI